MAWSTLPALAVFPNHETIVALRKILDWPSAGTWTVVSGWFVLLATTGFVRGVAASLGEEIGWRGFLNPLLYEKFGFTRGAFATGALWAIWHFPIIFFSNYNGATPWWFSPPCFVVEVLSLAIIMSWIRTRSDNYATGPISAGSPRA